MGDPKDKDPKQLIADLEDAGLFDYDPGSDEEAIREARLARREGGYDDD